MKKYPKTAETTEDLNKILRLVTFAKSCINFGWGWEVEILWKKGPSLTFERYGVGFPGDIKGWLINTTFKRPDILDGKIGKGKGRQIFIAKGASASSIFFSCVVCVKLIVEHEWMEAIRFNGKRILNPHNSVEMLGMIDDVQGLGMGPVLLAEAVNLWRNEQSIRKSKENMPAERKPNERKQNGLRTGRHQADAESLQGR